MSRFTGPSGGLHNNLHFLILEKLWEQATTFILRNPAGQSNLRLEGGGPTLSAASSRNAPISFIKKVLYRLEGKHVSRAVRSAIAACEEGTELWVFLANHSTPTEIKIAVAEDRVAFERSLCEWRAEEGGGAVEHERALKAIDSMREWGVTDAELLKIAMGDKTETNCFVRTVILALLVPNILDEEAIKFVKKFMLDFEGFTPGSEQGIAKLKKMSLALVDPKLLESSPKVIRVDFFRRLYEMRMEELNFSDFFDTGDVSVLPSVFSACRVFLLRLPCCRVVEDILEVAAELAERDWVDEVAGITLKELGGGVKDMFKELDSSPFFTDSHIPSFKNACGEILSCVSYFSTCSPSSPCPSSESHRNKLFVVLRLLHSEYYLHLRDQVKVTKSTREALHADISRFLTEQSTGIVSNAVLSQSSGSSARFWAMEGYKTAIVRSCRGGGKGAKGKVGRWKVCKLFATCAREHEGGTFSFLYPPISSPVLSVLFES